MHGNVTPTIRRNKPKPPSATAAAAAKAQQYIQDLCSRWELQAVSRGSHDPSAQLQATRILQQLTQYLGQHRSSFKHGSTRALLQKQLPPELLLNLLASGHDDILVATLHVLQDLAHIMPVLPVDAAPRLVQLVCCQSHGAAAARVLTAQLAHWRCSQLLPHWNAAGSTDKLFRQLQHLHVLTLTPVASSRNTASKAADGCVSMLMLLAKMASLAEQQMLAQLSADACTASRWLQLLVDVVQQQQTCLAGSHTGLQLQDSCLALLASLSRSPATSQALLASTQLRQSVLQLLHGVLRRPCCVSEADASHIQCWMNAATAASLPAMWQQQHHSQHAQHAAVSTLASHEEQQLLTDIAIAAAATLCNECFNSGAIAKQVDGAAALLLAAALLPCSAAYGSQRSCVSQFMGAVLGSSCCHVLLHALACSTTTTAEQAALLAAAAAAATASAAQAGLRPVTPDTAQEAPEGDTSSSAGLVALVPVQQDVQPAWLLLRMICAQCPVVAAGGEGNGAMGTRSSAAPFGASELPSPGRSGSQTPRTHVRQQMSLLHVASRGGSGPAVQPEQVLRVVQAYSSHITTGTDVHRVPGLLRSLHFLMCQSVLRGGLPARQQQQQEEGAVQQHHQQGHLQWLSLSSDGDTSSASSNGDGHDGVQQQLGSGSRQLLSSAAAVLDMISDCAGSDDSSEAAAAAGGSSPGQGSSSSRPSAHQLSWSLTASVYAALAVSVYLQEAVSSSGRPDASAAAAAMEAGRLSAPDSCLALAAIQLATAALKLLLPLVVAHAPQGQTTAVAAGGAAAAAMNGVQQPLLVVPLHEALECSLAAVQALATLTSLLQPALPGLLWQSVSSCGDGIGSDAGHQHAVKLKPAMVQGCVASAAAALDAELQQLLAQVVLSWQAPGCSSSPADVSTEGSSHPRGNRGASASPPMPLSVPAALQQHLQQELRCWAAAALVSCYGQLGARTWQGAVLEQFRHREAPFADVQLQLGPHHQVAGHAAVLAESCPVLRQQLMAAAAAAAVTPPAPAGLGHVGSSSSQHTCDTPGGSTQAAGGSGLVLKLSAAVDPQAFGQALDFIYTGAAVVQCAGLASQLQLCSSCLAPAVTPGSRQASQQQLAVRQHQQLQELQEQQQSGKQQLHRLGMLARKLQLPLLAALTRTNRPLPGQLLPDLHLSFASLLPRHMMVCAASGRSAAGPGRDDEAVAGAWCAGDVRTEQQQQQQQQQVGEHAHEQEVLLLGGSPPHAAETLQQHGQVQQLDACGHSSTADYLAMLAACTAADSAGAGPQQLFARSAGAAGAGSPAQHAPCRSTPQGGPGSSFADVFIAAPALALPCSGTAAAECTQQQLPAAALQEGCAEGRVVYGFLPAHRVLLSGCCPYFEALLSDRWHHDSCQHAASAVPDHQQQPGAQVPRRVVVVPEADIHVAAALQHYLYTGSLQVQLPPQASPASPSGATGPDQEGCQQSDGPQKAQAVGQAVAVALNGCSQGCHQARTLLRLWRGAELLLLPGLQALCVAAVDAAAWQLGVRCCLVLLADCCQLGVPSAADGLLAALTQRTDRDTAAALPEWDELPSGLQAVLTKAWAERRRLQQEGEDVPAAAPGPHAAPVGAGNGGLGLVPLVAVGPNASVAPQSSAGAALVHVSLSGCSPGVSGQQEALLLQPPARRAEPVLVGWRHVQGLREAGEHLGGVIGTQLPHLKG